MNTPTYHIGQILPNGALVIAARRMGDTDRWIVLAIKEGGRASHLYEPYVTWEANGDGHTYWGHYYSNFNAAARDYAGR